MNKLYFLPFFALISFISSAQNFGDIIITEIMKNPSAVSDNNGEWFEIYNTTNLPINMNGWTIRDEDSDFFTISSALIVPANGYAVLGRNGEGNGGVPLNYVYGSNMNLANDAIDEIIIEAPGSVLIDSVIYDEGTTFPDLEGASMELSQSSFNATDNDSGVNWGAATTPYGNGDLGSPGSNNDFTLSYAKQDQLTDLKLYPNPALGNTVSLTTGKNTIKYISVFDVLGKELLRKTLTDNTLDVSSLSAGVYILKVTQDNRTATRKLVVR